MDSGGTMSPPLMVKYKGQWYDALKKPEPPHKWTDEDFEYSYSGNETTLKIKSSLRQYFKIGDSFEANTYIIGSWASTPIPGLLVGSGMYIKGTITGGTEITDAIDLYWSSGGGQYTHFRTNLGKYIPIKG